MASGYVLQLQKQYGNRYVQRQVASAKRQPGEQQIVSGNASEATDGAAGQLARAPGRSLHRQCGCGGETTAAGECKSCSEKSETEGQSRFLQGSPASTRDGGAPASPSTPSEACEQFPGGSTDCEVDEETGTPTGKVTHQIDETNPCTKPCVEEHESVHVRQLRTFCPTLRDCYLAADKGKRPASDCVKMAIFEGSQRECEAYKVSVPCMEKRLKNEKSCQSKENKEYGTRKLTSERCFHDKSCGAAGAK